MYTKEIESNGFAVIPNVLDPATVAWLVGGYASFVAAFVIFIKRQVTQKGDTSGVFFH